MPVILRLGLLLFVAASILIGCSSKDTGHDVPPPGGTPKRGVPKFIQERNKKP